MIAKERVNLSSVDCNLDAEQYSPESVHFHMSLTMGGSEWRGGVVSFKEEEAWELVEALTRVILAARDHKNNAA